MAIFALRAVLQPALTLGYLATFTMPRAYGELHSEVAGVLIGLSMILTCLVHFRCRSSVHHPTEVHAQLREPLITSLTERLIEHRGCSWIVLLAITFEIGNAAAHKDFVNFLILAMIEYAVLLDVTNLSFKQIVFCLVLGLSVAGALHAVVPATRPFSSAIMTGILFGSVATYSLPLWDHGKSTKIGFTLGSISVLTLFIGASTLDIIH